MPTSAHADEEIEEPYQQIEEILMDVDIKDNLMVLGDWNAIVGEETMNVVGKFGLGKHNKRCQRLVEFCICHDLIITNTMFDQPKRRRYTWTAERYQLDYILVRNRYRNEMKNSKSFPVADVESDHIPIIMTSQLYMKKLRINNIYKRRYIKEIKTTKSC